MHGLKTQVTKLLGIDTGGTYTDAVLLDEAEGVLASAKALTTKHDLAVGIGEAVRAVLPGGEGETGAEIGLVSVSTTLATNAVVEGQGRRACLMLVGFDESALDRAGLRQALGDDPVVFIDGGHSPHGEAQRPLDLEAARAAIAVHAESVSAFAVAGHFAVRNPAHEIALRNLLHELTDRPVTCGHELSSNLDAPRRALTTLLNARLIPLLQQLILAVGELLGELGIEAPLMVVKGDGSLISAETALNRPIETVLSGPAASAIGAHHLSGERDIMVADMGGTTTDIALLRDGLPLLRRDGADVGGWRTMVEAVAVHTVGLGGDSEVHFDREQGLRLGPRRVVPLSLLALQHPEVLPELRAMGETPPKGDHGGRFALRLRALDEGAPPLRKADAALWQALEQGPQPLGRLITNYLEARALDRLVAAGLAIVAGFTPSDAAHVLGLHKAWSGEAAALGAEIWLRELTNLGISATHDPIVDSKSTDGVRGFCESVIEQVVRQTGETLVAAALAEDRGGGSDAFSRPQGLGRYLVDRALSGGSGETARGTVPLLDVALSLAVPLAAIGAPAATYYPAVAERLGTRLCLPSHGEVCNAVGAVASGVMQRVSLLITAPREGQFRLHLTEGTSDFTDLEHAAEAAEAEAGRLAETRAREAGAGDIVVRVERRDRIAPGADGMDNFIESRITARAAGRPRLAGEP